MKTTYQPDQKKLAELRLNIKEALDKGLDATGYADQYFGMIKDIIENTKDENLKAKWIDYLDSEKEFIAQTQDHVS